MTRHLTAAIAALSLALPATAQTLPGGVLPGPLFPQPGSGSLFPGNGSLFPNSSMPQQHGNFGGGRHHGHGFGSGGFIIYEDQPEVVHDVVVVHDQPAAAPEPPPPAPPREPCDRPHLRLASGRVPEDGRGRRLLLPLQRGMVPAGGSAVQGRGAALAAASPFACWRLTLVHLRATRSLKSERWFQSACRSRPRPLLPGLRGAFMFQLGANEFQHLKGGAE
jgi:hypothetical protein